MAPERRPADHPGGGRPEDAARPSPARDDLLVVESICVHYGSIRALTDVSLRVARGEVVTLIGANGAGKTTTLRTITGLLAPRSGSIRFAGESTVGVPTHRLVSRGISMSPEGRGVFADLTVLENLRMGGYVRSKAEVKEGIARAFAMFPRLAEREWQRAGTLSGGEQQMLAMARALMSRPRLLLLDEPSLGLAPLVVHTIFEAIDAIRREGTTILLVEQNANAALQHSERAYVLETGRIVMEGPSAELAANPKIKEAYLGE